MTFEITTRWDATLLAVDHVEQSFALCGVALIVDGVVVVPASGRIALIDYAIREVARPARALPLAHTDDRRVVPYVVAALAVHLAVWGLAVQVPPEVRPAKPTSTVKLPRPAVVHVPDTRAEHPVGNGQAAATRDAEGRAGAPDAPRERGHIAMQNIGEEPQLSKIEQIAQARRAGILGNTAAFEEKFRALTGKDAVSSGFDQTNVTASLDGGDGSSAGSFGFGRTGFGQGGGGNPLDMIGTAKNFGASSTGTTHGHAWDQQFPPTPTKWSTGPWTTWPGPYTYEYHSIRPRIPGPSMVLCAVAAKCHVTGELDPTIVRRYVRRNAPKLEYCYEKELLSKPTLEGTVAVSFTIQNDGRVATASANGVDKIVAGCVGEVIAAIEFPAAIGPTIVDYTLGFRRPLPPPKR